VHNTTKNIQRATALYARRWGQIFTYILMLLLLLNLRIKWDQLSYKMVHVKRNQTAEDYITLHKIVFRVPKITRTARTLVCVRLTMVIWCPHSIICMLHGGLATLQTIPFFASANPYWHRNGLACTDSVLAYGHHIPYRPAWLAYGQQLPAVQANVGTRQTSGCTPGQTRSKHNAPLQRRGE